MSKIPRARAEFYDAVLRQAYSIGKSGSMSNAESESHALTPSPLKSATIRNNQNASPGLSTKVRHADVLIVTAVDDEYEAVKQVFNRRDNEDKELQVEDVVVRSTVHESGGVRARIAFLHLAEMGMVPAAALVTRYSMILGVRFVLAVGICAGRREKTNIGDIIIASDIFNYDSVKRQVDGNLADYPHAPLDARVWDVVKRVLDQDELASKIERNWPPQASRPDTRLNILHGPLATGSALVADRAVFREISEHQRRVIGIDMEAYGIARAVHYLDGVSCLVVKSVADHADDEKADGSVTQGFAEYRKYCCHTSASMAKHILDRLVL